LEIYCINLDTQGLPYMLHISAANLTDRAGSLAMFARYRQDLPNVSNVLTYSHSVIHKSVTWPSVVKKVVNIQ
jgi:hypothetical protein